MQKNLTLITLTLIFSIIAMGAVAAESPDDVITNNTSDQTVQNITNNTTSNAPDPEVWRDGILIYSTTISIQDAMDHAQNGDTIRLENGQTFYENLVINKNLTFEVMNGGIATIDGSGTGRVIHILPGVTAYFYNITFQNGHAPDGTLLSPDGKNGGGILNEGTLYLINCVVRNNTAGDGGSITYGGIGGSGGGIYSTGILNLTNTLVYNNWAGNGSDGVTVTHSDGFHGGHGGGIYSTGQLNIENSAMHNNHAGDGGNGVVLGEGGSGGSGGAIYTTGTLTITNTQIYDNYAGNAGKGGIEIIIGGTGGSGGNGGAIYNSGNANIECSEIYSNTAGDGGTGAAAADGNLIHKTGYDGHQGGPGGNGGAIYNQGTLSLLETDIYSNTAGNGGAGGAGGDGRDRDGLGSGGAGGAGGIGGTGGAGAAIYNTGTGTFTLTDCSITQNTAGNGGVGGTGGQGGNARSTGLFYKGSAYTGGAGGIGGAGGNGGAIYYNNGTNGSITNSNLIENQAGNGGQGGQGGQGGASSGSYSNGSGGAGGIAGNGGNGGAIYYCNGSLTVESNNLIDNTAGDGGLGGSGGLPGPGTGSGTIGTDGLDGYSGTGGAFYAANNTSLNFNRILGNDADVVAAGGVTVHAENNWWGSNNEPDNRVSAGVVYSPWIMLRIFANPGTIHYLDTSDIVADLTWNTFDGVTPYEQPTGNHIPDKTPVTFGTNIGDINPEDTETTSGTADSTFTGTTVGTATVSAQVDNEIQTTTVEVEKADTVMTVDSASGVYLGSTTLSATLVDEYGNPVGGVQVDFYVDGVWVGSDITDGSGYAEVTYSPITVNPASNPHIITAEFAGNDYYNESSGTNDLNVERATTHITVDNITGNKGQTVNLTATLKDQYGNLLAGRTINFLVNGINAGSAVTDVNGVATKSYYINLNGGTYTIQADFVGDDYYQSSTGTGALKVSQADLYVKSWASKNNPYVGETITLTFKLGNRGPDTAENVVFTMKIPEGMQYVSSNVDIGTLTYNESTRTITWTIGDVPVGDPYLYMKVKVLKSGTYIFRPQITTDTYDPTIDKNIQSVVINAQSKHHGGHKVPMHKTGVPIWSLILALVFVAGGLIVPFKK